MVRLFILLCGFLINSISLYADDFIAVGERPLKLRKSTKCGELLTSTAQDICDCCLLKYTKIYELSSTEALEACQNANFCRQDLERSADSALQQARQNLKPFEIIDIEGLIQPPALPQDGVFDEQDMLGIIISLTAQDYLPAFISRLVGKNSDHSCIKIKALGDSARGVHSGQLFAVSINERCLKEDDTLQEPSWRVIYIIKESKKGWSELFNLYQVKISALGNEYQASERTLFSDADATQELSARVTFDDLHFKLTTKGTRRYFSFLQAAQGKSLQDQLSNFGAAISNPTISPTEYDAELLKVKNMFYRVGFAMSKLHQKYAILSTRKHKKLGKTYIHGDFHGQNVFYDYLSDTVTLIDNETFSLALKKKTTGVKDRRSSGVNDIVDLYLLGTIKTVAHQFSKQIRINTQLHISDKLWHELWHDLLLGYLKAYDFNDAETLKDAYWEFRSKFYEGLSNAQVFDSIKNFKDQRVLKRFGPSKRRYYVKEHYLNQTFIALQDSLGIKNLP